MQCSKCGKDVRYIVLSTGITITCEPSEYTIYTEKGRVQKGYMAHECRKDNKREENKKEN